MLTRAQVIAAFKSSFPAKKGADIHALKVSFDEYIDSLRKSGQITAKTYDSITFPYASRIGGGMNPRKRNSTQDHRAMWASQVPRGSIIRGVRVGALIRPVFAQGKEIYRVPPNAIVAAGYRYDTKKEAMRLTGDFHDFVVALSQLLYGSPKALTTADFAPLL